MQAMQFLFDTVISLLSVIFVLRIWCQFNQVDFYNPLSQSIAKCTTPILRPLSKVFPTVKRINISALVVLFCLGFIKLPLMSFSFDISIFGYYALVGVLNMLSTFGKLLIWLLFIGAIMSWFNTYNPLQAMINQLTDPILNKVRRVLPKTGMLDFSPMVVVFVLYFINLLFNEYVPLWRLV